MADDLSIRRGLVPATMTPEGSGTSVISNEELQRREKFFKIDRSGRPTFMGKQPDASLRPGEAVVALDPAGKARVVNSLQAGSDTALLQRLGPLLGRLGKGGGAAGFVLGIPGLVDLLQQFQRDPFLFRRGQVPLAQADQSADIQLAQAVAGMEFPRGMDGTVAGIGELRHPLISPLAPGSPLDRRRPFFAQIAPQPMTPEEARRFSLRTPDVARHNRTGRRGPF